MMPLTVQIFALVSFILILPLDSYAGGGHVHFGRSEFVNGGIAPGQISASIQEIERNAQLAQEMLTAGDLSEIKEIAASISDISGHLAESAGMNRARHANMKRASRDISKAADKLGEFVEEGNIPKAQGQIERIQKLLDFMG